MASASIKRLSSQRVSSRRVSSKKASVRKTAKKVSYAMKHTGASRMKLVKLIGTLRRDCLLAVAAPHIVLKDDESDTKKLLLRKLYAAGDEAVVEAYNDAVENYEL